MNIEVFKFYILNRRPVRLEGIRTNWPIDNVGIILNWLCYLMDAIPLCDNIEEYIYIFTSIHNKFYNSK
jgi:hypothetical protein